MKPSTRHSRSGAARPLPRRAAARTRTPPAAPADADETRERILRSAERVFARRGFAAATTQELAAEAGIQKRMLFYYFPTKDDLYTRVLERLFAGIQAIHQHFRGEPGPEGLADVMAALMQSAAERPEPILILIREIMDEGAHLDRVAGQWVGPLFRAGMDEVRRSMATGLYRQLPPEHVLSVVGGLTLFWVLTAPLTRRVTGQDPLARRAIARHAALATEFALGGLLAARSPATTKRPGGR